MAKVIFNQIKDILNLYKSLINNKSKKDEIELYLKTVLNELEFNFDKIYKSKVEVNESIEIPICDNIDNVNKITFGDF